ncbi:hypothetical protein ARTHRO9V_210173 [Arthrobacter sp. 9V]|uniref:hypothetical protein n=1 Tax=Arthrobacter sp. 9V TaxID=2653132 RepID=UPI0012F467BA|nr:hypothetical protein [Arthrobacter sp. 9V]VXC14536.1 hypothetical protein ARTHRO9V_210173 [Arthrobacter sp. 9V]
MTTVDATLKPFILGNWQARPEELSEIAVKLLKTLTLVESSVNSGRMEWAFDAGGEAEFRLRPFPTDADPSDIDLKPFLRKDDAQRVWTKGGLTVLLYGRASDWPTGKMVSVTGTVGADTRLGNSLEIAFLPRDGDLMLSSSDLSYLVEEIGELWNATWFAVLTDEIIDSTEQTFGEPEIGIISYWADTINRPLPASSNVTIRKTVKGMLAQVHDMSSKAAITYALKVKQM